MSNIKIIQQPTEIHAAFNPVIFCFQNTGEEGAPLLVKLIFENNNGQDDDTIDLSLSFYNNFATLDVSSFLRSAFANKPLNSINTSALTPDIALFCMYKLKYDGITTSPFTAVRSASQIGETHDLLPIYGCLLTGFKKLYSYDNYLADVSLLGKTLLGFSSWSFPNIDWDFPLPTPDTYAAFTPLLKSLGAKSPDKELTLKGSVRKAVLRKRIGCDKETDEDDASSPFATESCTAEWGGFVELEELKVYNYNFHMNVDMPMSVRCGIDYITVGGNSEGRVEFYDYQREASISIDAAKEQGYSLRINAYEASVKNIIIKDKNGNDVTNKFSISDGGSQAQITPIEKIAYGNVDIYFDYVAGVREGKLVIACDNETEELWSTRLDIQTDCYQSGEMFEALPYTKGDERSIRFMYINERQLRIRIPKTPEMETKKIEVVIPGGLHVEYMYYEILLTSESWLDMHEIKLKLKITNQ